ncbi:MAG: hypothetical protein ACRDSP_19240 [Pseudonocardiaceae bacterium]
MALYTPQAQRRRLLLIFAVAAFLLGGILGGFVGRLTAPTPAERVAQVQDQARQMSAQLRVVSLHAETKAASLGAGGDAGSALALQRADGDLADALEQAPWIPAQQGNALRSRLHGLEHTASAQAASPSFGADVDRLASDVDSTFGVAAHS